MRIIITGSTGFVGRHLVPKLLNAGHELLEITIDPDLSGKLYGDQTNKYIITDDQKSFTTAVVEYNPDLVIHLASYLTSLDDYSTLQKLLDANIIFSCRLLDALKNSNLKGFINTGTFAEYQEGDAIFDPAYLYAATKTAARSFLDYYAKVYNFKQITIVPYTIYGGNDTQRKIIDIITDSINTKTPLDLSPGEQMLDFIHVNDIVELFLRVIENIHLLPKKKNIQAGTGKGTTLKQLALLIENITHNKTNINWGGKPYRPSDIMYAVAETPTVSFWKAAIDIETGLIDYLKMNNKL